jgi:3-hydroxyisobutyrate dehydrogenase
MMESDGRFGGAARVGFVGLGAMGAPMVHRLCAAGLEVHVFDLIEKLRAKAADQSGAVPVAGARDLGRCRSIVLMLPDSEAVEAALFDADTGLLAVLQPGTLVIDMGSSNPISTVRLATAVAAAGAKLIDAPVSGGVRAAVDGDLTIMIGGPDAAVEACWPIVSKLGKQIHHVGATGAGHTMKALNNLMSATNLLIAVEVLEIGKRMGLEPETMLAVLQTSTGRNSAVEGKIQRHVLTETYDSGFRLALMKKDVSTALALADAAHVDARLASTCLERWTVASELLPAEADQTEVVRIVQRGADQLAAYQTPATHRRATT